MLTMMERISEELMLIRSFCMAHDMSEINVSAIQYRDSNDELIYTIQEDDDFEYPSTWLTVKEGRVVTVV